MSQQHRQSDIFKNNFIIWNVFGIWPGRNQSKYYKYYSFTYLIISLLLYNIMLTLNLAYTPRKIEFIIRELIFFFTAFTVTSKALMVICMRDEINKALNLLDSETMDGDDEESKLSIAHNYARYQNFFKLFLIIGNTAYTCKVLMPIFLHFMFESSIELPICNYYFLNDEIRDKYFVLWFIYQSFGIYGHMIYNITVDSFVAGLLLIAIYQCKVLNSKLFNLKITTDEKHLNAEVQEQIPMAKLRKCLWRYDFLLNYCNTVQKVIDSMIFVQFGITCIILCVVMCGLLLKSSTENYIFMVLYLFTIIMQIFVPGYLGTQLSFESQKLVFAAYNTEWIPRSGSFNRSIRIFVERANIPIQMSGLKMFPLSLITFTSIMKSAYSFFTLVRNFQD